ncbi:DNA mismatch repair endonuclease MutL, partial [Candidatus Microgenomates bacterium]|nr:DNA mismatch repair endonuclease MutL [Candidatus Microgenomates bacterium]
VKELIENAIDASATEIKIYLEDAGLKKILIVDNGYGMSKEDVGESWKPHTTSKIADEHDLHSIKSLGFRGEALSSLAAVSTLTIQSRPPETRTGFSVTIKDGSLCQSSEVGMPMGTSIQVEQLFSRLPGRKKFLKPPQVELRHTIDVVNHFALSYPSIRFMLSHGKKTILDYPPTDARIDRIEHVMGPTASSLFIPLSKSTSYISASGYIAKPQLNATSQNKQYIFINSRKVSDKRIATAVKGAYGTMLESTRYPLFILFLSLPFEMVDVNVHPRKEQVDFLNSAFVCQAIKQFIAETLAENNLIFENLSWKRTGVGLSNSYAGKVLKNTVLDTESFSGNEKVTLLQFQKLYIIVSSKSEIFIVDQHAAHERILFEKLKKEFIKQKEKKALFKLPKPIALKLSAAESVTLNEYLPLLQRIGFVLQSTIMTHVPLLFQDRDPRELLMRYLEDLEQGHTNVVDNASEEMLAFLACRAAVKAGDELAEYQMKKILVDLETVPNNATCPHGRPTRIGIPIDQLNALFKRT